MNETNAAEYVETAMRGRLEDLALLQRAVDRAEDLSYGDMADLESLGAGGEDVAVEAEEVLDEYPLCVESTVCYEIVFGTGGPDDRLVIECEAPSDKEGWHGAEIRRILYRYSWSGSAERVLLGEDHDVAERFARSVVPELAE